MLTGESIQKMYSDELRLVSGSNGVNKTKKPPLVPREKTLRPIIRVIKQKRIVTRQVIANETKLSGYAIDKCLIHLFDVGVIRKHYIGMKGGHKSYQYSIK